MDYECEAIGYVRKPTCLPSWKEIKDVNARFISRLPGWEVFFVFKAFTMEGSDEWLHNFSTVNLNNYTNKNYGGWKKYVKKFQQKSFFSNISCCIIKWNICNVNYCK